MNEKVVKIVSIFLVVIMLGSFVAMILSYFM